MEIVARRFLSDLDATLSEVMVDGRFECFGLEDEQREEKVPGETRIPAGKYKVGVRTAGGFHSRYSHRFGSAHRGMLQVMDVPGFEYILIHIGNTERNTAGCLLVGAGCATGGELQLISSTDAYQRLYSRVIAAAEYGELSIRYIDEDG